jgi:hypothetical protein
MDAVIIEEFSNVRLLIIKYAKISGNLSSLSNKLRYVEWKEYPFMYLPSTYLILALLYILIFLGVLECLKIQAFEYK